MMMLLFNSVNLLFGDESMTIGPLHFFFFFFLEFQKMKWARWSLIHMHIHTCIKYIVYDLYVIVEFCEFIA